MNQYEYDGPVMEFGICIAHRWTASTYAPSERKAKSNLTYRFKKEHNRAPTAKITLPGKLALLQQKENL